MYLPSLGQPSTAHQAPHPTGNQSACPPSEGDPSKASLGALAYPSPPINFNGGSLSRASLGGTCLLHPPPIKFDGGEPLKGLPGGHPPPIKFERGGGVSRATLGGTRPPSPHQI